MEEKELENNSHNSRKKITDRIIPNKENLNKAGDYVREKYQQTKDQVKKTKHNVHEKYQQTKDQVKKAGHQVKRAGHHVGKKVSKPFKVVKDAMAVREDEVRFYFNNYMHTGNIHYKNDPTTTLDYLQAQNIYLQAQIPQMNDALNQGFYGQKLSELGTKIKLMFEQQGWHYSFIEFLPQTPIKKTVILWHGIGSWSGDLCHIREMTKNGIYVVAVDLLGHGASNSNAQPQKISTPKGHINSYTEWTEQIANATIAIQKLIIDNLAVEVITAGISLSGMLTTKAIIDYGDELPKRTILISPGYAAAGGLWLGNVPILKNWKGLVNFAKRYVPSFNRNSPFYVGEVLRIIKNANFSKKLNYNNLYTGHMTEDHEKYANDYYKELKISRDYITTEVTDKLYKEVCRVSLELEKLIGQIEKRNFFIITTGKNEIDDKIICKHLIKQYIKKLRSNNNDVKHINLDEVDDHEPIFNYKRVINRPAKQDIMKIMADYVLHNF